MQTFLPYASFRLSATVLDNRRLGKQRVEAHQIIRALSDPDYGWQSHPAVNMWRGYAPALQLYANTMIYEWLGRGFQNTLPIVTLPNKVMMPSWLGDSRLHTSHQSNLLRKNPAHYRQYGWPVSADMPYFWPQAEGEAQAGAKKR